MYAVFLSGGKQYRVIKNQIVQLEKLNILPGKIIKFHHVLLISDKNSTKIGDPFVTGGIVTAQIENHGRSKKIKIIKFNRRKHYKKQQGHRQHFTSVKITEIHNNEG